MTAGGPSKGDSDMKIHLSFPSGGRPLEVIFLHRPTLSSQIIYIHWTSHFSNFKIGLLFPYYETVRI